MAEYPRVVSIRIEPELLLAVRERAQADGRSLSGQIVHFVREQVEAVPVSSEKPRPISGWLAHLEAPETHAEFAEGRAEASAKIRRSTSRKTRKR
jgi:hypothetical protein